MELGEIHGQPGVVVGMLGKYFRIPDKFCLHTPHRAHTHMVDDTP